MTHKLKNSPSFILFTILFAILIPGLIGGIFLSIDLKKHFTNNTIIVNKLGQIRGLSQRYVKLKLANLNSDLIVKKTNQNFEFLDTYFKSKNLITKPKINSLYTQIKILWKKLKLASNENDLIKISEELWKASNELTSLVANMFEKKQEECIRKVLVLNVILAFIVITMSIIIYFKIQKGLEKDKITDPLTNLYNRRYFNEKIKHFINYYNKYKEPFSAIFIDIDHFKKINDIYGHQKGDEILQEISHIIKSSIRNSDLAFRYGGEEIVVLLPNTDLKTAYSIAKRLKEKIKTIKLDDSKHITASMGVGEYKGETLKEFIKKVDSALYKAKEEGRDKIIVC